MRGASLQAMTGSSTLLKGMQRTWKKQFYILSILAVLLVGLCLFIWFHPTAGYGFGDLRSDMIQILWICFAIVGVISSIILIVSSKFIRSWLIWIVAYVFGLIAVVLLLPIIDKYY